jgi:hypothetical protein
LFDADFLSRSDLHAVDVLAIPDRFEQPVAKAEHHYVLNGFFPEVVIDAINLIFVQNLLDFLVQLPG